ncbi:hypothetical protein B0H11DRAFT_2218484 [Mycena galericulata]|nr:hypothetical protein B0H11DRAFT_2218484 [Mycena galericulata]
MNGRHRQRSARIARAHRAGRKRKQKALPRLLTPVIFGLDPPFMRALGLQMDLDDRNARAQLLAANREPREGEWGYNSWAHLPPHDGMTGNWGSLAHLT